PSCCIISSPTRICRRCIARIASRDMLQHKYSAVPAAGKRYVVRDSIEAAGTWPVLPCLKRARNTLHRGFRPVPPVACHPLKELQQRQIGAQRYKSECLPAPYSDLQIGHGG